ncbi:hypothetical protein [Granulosicoccus antarcticus]|uniref:Uncharacterized protein n=1 Tax=Granulosicoccus antarcticus IMCC3135 TaxID=1192854 RepID=A0A2Z2NSD6_9GAMM|nr:hypothetical protein [Granulosicoccus antarcticus]ASJ70487.1 hypothetical protein IMCC3135_01865 [Granulosicoccus antarcticus IMCC3135]
MRSVGLCSLLLGCLLILGCDDSSDGKPNEISDDSPGESTSGEVNGGLSGKIISTYRFRPYQFDLASGAATEISLFSTYDLIEDLEANSGGDKPSAEYNYFTASSNPANQGYVEVLYDCYRGPTRSCVSIYDENFIAVRRIVTEAWYQKPAKLSDSGKYVVMSDRYGTFNDIALIQIMDVSLGRVADSIEMPDVSKDDDKRADHAVTEWGINDELIFSIPSDERPTIYVTAPGTTEIERKITLPRSFSGFVRSLDMHPDGEQLLIGYGGNTDGLVEQNGLALVLNLSDLSVRIPAIDYADANRSPIGENFKSQFINPIWSPDGTQIMILNLFSIGGSALTPSVIYADGTTVVNPYLVINDNLIVIPAGSDRLVINNADDTYSDSVKIAVFEDVVDSRRRLSTRWRGDQFKEEFFSWIP